MPNCGDCPKSQYQSFITLMVSPQQKDSNNQRFLIFSTEELDRDILGLGLVAEIETR
jgi:hypothetical protein